MTHAITRTQARPVSRFIDAQRAHYPQILREIRQGRKRTHWMWYVFPQLAALGKSETARYYGLADRKEALAYLDNPVLRLRLGECTMAILAHDRLMLDRPDDRKLRSSMTLFSQVVVDPALPNAVLAKFFDGPDQLTLDVLAGKPIPQQTAMGRVEVRTKWKQSTITLPSRGADEPMSRREVQSFIGGFGLPSGVTRQIVEEWMADQDRANTAGWESRADAAYYDEH